MECTPCLKHCETTSRLDYKKQADRMALLEHARKLARSGEHADADSVMAAMQDIEDFTEVQHWFQDWAFRHQLDRLCTLAR